MAYQRGGGNQGGGGYQRNGGRPQGNAPGRGTVYISRCLRLCITTPA
jgi:hypothetical protein